MSWCCLSLALFEARSNNWLEAEIWSRRTLFYGAPLSRSAAAQAILAISLFRSGQVAEARAELAGAQAAISDRFKTELAPYEGNAHWFDWVLARILVREANAVINL